MHHDYSDIRSRISEQPRWFDEAGVPRYCEFAHDQTNFIYADTAVLLEIACQSCGRRFKVCLSEWYLSRSSLAEAVQNRSIHYGDPPNVGCCPAGPTMSSDSLRVLEFWMIGKDHRWMRVPELEIELED